MAKNKKDKEGVDDVNDIVEAKDPQTPQEFGEKYLNENPKLGYDSVIVTSDGAVFLPSLQGENYALNHSKKFTDQSMIVVSRPEIPAE